MQDRPIDVVQWMKHPMQKGMGDNGIPDGSWEKMMCRVARFLNNW